MNPHADLDFDAAEQGLLARGRGRMVPDLDRITLLLELLGQPQLTYPSVHVTGTNGKGSAVRTTAMLLSAVGLSAGTYTSPHVQTIRERLMVSGRRIGEQEFADLYADVAPLAALVDERSRDAVTFFELLTAMAFWWFAEVPVDVGVVEVGMGGTWDATNLVRGDVAVIQPVDVDHKELGSTPVEIAREKAGIIKPGGTVVCAPQRDDVMRVLRSRADDVGATVRPWGDDHRLVSRATSPGGQTIHAVVDGREFTDLFVPLAGPHQADNAVMALAAVAALLGERFHDLDGDALASGMLAASVPGRLETVALDPTVVLDGAHNPHGARAAAAAVAEAHPQGDRTLVVGMMTDKDHEGILRAWRDHVTHVVVTRPSYPRAHAPTRLAAVAEDVWRGTGVAVEVADDVATAIDLATDVTAPDGTIVVTGSLYTVGEARDRFLPVLDDDDEVVREPEDVDDDDDERRFAAALDDMIERLDEEYGGEP